jgi:hypothetical protein
MRRKAHHLMWPRKLYVADGAPPALLEEENRFRQMPRLMPAAQYVVQARQPHTEVVLYEETKPVQDLVQRFEGLNM